MLFLDDVSNISLRLALAHLIPDAGTRGYQVSTLNVGTCMGATTDAAATIVAAVYSH